VRRDNQAARTIYERIGFGYVGDSNGRADSIVHTMELTFL
jgi:ribosomal protein S18 acetylase RimI-like enzyme